MLAVQDKWESWTASTSKCPQHLDGPAVDSLTKPRCAHPFSGLDSWIVLPDFFWQYSFHCCAVVVILLHCCHAGETQYAVAHAVIMVMAPCVNMFAIARTPSLQLKLLVCMALYATVPWEFCSHCAQGLHPLCYIALSISPKARTQGSSGRGQACVVTFVWHSAFDLPDHKHCRRLAHPLPLGLDADC